MPSGDVIAAGNFSSAGGLADNNFDFLVAFFGGAADINRDGSTTSQDFFDLLAAFFTGC